MEVKVALKTVAALPEDAAAAPGRIDFDLFGDDGYEHRPFFANASAGIIRPTTLEPAISIDVSARPA